MFSGSAFLLSVIGHFAVVAKFAIAIEVVCIPSFPKLWYVWSLCCERINSDSCVFFFLSCHP